MIDLKFYYHQLKERESDIPKITLKTRYSHYDFLEISFVLTNAHATLMDLMNKVLESYHDMLVIVFINEILIYSYNEKDHATHRRIFLLTLKDQKLYAKFSKCEF